MPKKIRYQSGTKSSLTPKPVAIDIFSSQDANLLLETINLKQDNNLVFGSSNVLENDFTTFDELAEIIGEGSFLNIIDKRVDTWTVYQGFFNVQPSLTPRRICFMGLRTVRAKNSASITTSTTNQTTYTNLTTNETSFFAWTYVSQIEFFTRDGSSININIARDLALNTLTNLSLGTANANKITQVNSAGTGFNFIDLPQGSTGIIDLRKYTSQSQLHIAYLAGEFKIGDQVLMNIVSSRMFSGIVQHFTSNIIYLSGESTTLNVMPNGTTAANIKSFGYCTISTGLASLPPFTVSTLNFRVPLVPTTNDMPANKKYVDDTATTTLASAKTYTDSKIGVVGFVDLRTYSTFAQINNAYSKGEFKIGSPVLMTPTNITNRIFVGVCIVWSGIIRFKGTAYEINTLSATIATNVGMISTSTVDPGIVFTADTTNALSADLEGVSLTALYDKVTEVGIIGYKTHDLTSMIKNSEVWAYIKNEDNKVKKGDNFIFNILGNIMEFTFQSFSYLTGKALFEEDHISATDNVIILTIIIEDNDYIINANTPTYERFNVSTPLADTNPSTKMYVDELVEEVDDNLTPIRESLNNLAFQKANKTLDNITNEVFKKKAQDAGLNARNYTHDLTNFSKVNEVWDYVVDTNNDIQIGDFCIFMFNGKVIFTTFYGYKTDATFLTFKGEYYDSNNIIVKCEILVPSGSTAGIYPDEIVHKNLKLSDPKTAEDGTNKGYVDNIVQTLTTQINSLKTTIADIQDDLNTLTPKVSVWKDITTSFRTRAWAPTDRGKAIRITFQIRGDYDRYMLYGNVNPYRDGWATYSINTSVRFFDELALPNTQTRAYTLDWNQKNPNTLIFSYHTFMGNGVLNLSNANNVIKTDQVDIASYIASGLLQVEIYE